MKGFKETNVFLIHFLTFLSTMYYLPLLYSSVMDLVFLNDKISSGVPIDPRFPTTQKYKIGVISSLLCTNLIVHTSFLNKSFNLGGTAIVYFVLANIAHSQVFLYYILLRLTYTDMESTSRSIDFESSTLGCGIISSVGLVLLNAMYLWLLWMCKTTGLWGVGNYFKVFGIRIKILLQFLCILVLPFIYILVASAVKKLNDGGDHFNVTFIMYYGSGAVVALSKTLMFFGVQRRSVPLLHWVFWIGLASSNFYYIFEILTKVTDVRISGTFNQKVFQIFARTLVAWKIYVEFTLLFLYIRNLEGKGTNTNIDVLDDEKIRITMLHSKNITVEENRVIGSGNFSTVYRGCLKQRRMFRIGSTRQTVAVKLHSGNADVNTVYKELTNMSRLMKIGHKNLVRFYGLSIDKGNKNDNDSDGETPIPTRFSIVMELCSNGGVAEYLKLMAQPKRNRMPLNTQIEVTVNDPYEQELQSYTKQILIWAKGVAEGMQFLQDNEIIHGDLAARNVLLDEEMTAKISDFGMSFKLYNYQMYAVSNQEQFPFKWMAPESFDSLTFSKKTDVWSYGVLLWELFSAGNVPWPERVWTSDFSSELKNGLRLEKPEYASNEIYEGICLECWNIDPHRRPSFSEILLCYDSILSRSHQAGIN